MILGVRILTRWSKATCKSRLGNRHDSCKMQWRTFPSPFWPPSLIPPFINDSGSISPALVRPNIVWLVDTYISTKHVWRGERFLMFLFILFWQFNYDLSKFYTFVKIFIILLPKWCLFLLLLTCKVKFTRICN